MSTNKVLPIIYRCDKKYLTFLVNSIHSVLKFYKGDSLLHFYICTNDELDLLELNKLQQKYTFNYEKIKIDDIFLENFDLLKHKTNFSLKKYYGFNFEDIRSNNYSDTFQYNPFCRSKSIIATCLFFMAVTHYDYIIGLDTDTLVVSDISNLLEYDLTNYICSSCADWGYQPTMFNPSVSVWNLKNYQKAFFKENGIYDQLQVICNSELSPELPFCEAVQKMLNTVIDRNVYYIDRAWNTPITHIHLHKSPKIYHFSESWSGKQKIHRIYNELVDKYLKNE